MLTKDLAICIRATDFSETSQIVVFFTRENGKVSAIAKGSKRPKSTFDGPIEVFAHGKIVFSDPSKSDPNKEKLATLTEFQQQGGFANLNQNLFVLHCCLFAVELLNSMTGDCDPHPQLFDSFLQFLRNVDEQRTMNNEQRDVMSLLIQFQLSLLREVGLMPVLDACVNCKTSHERRATRDEFYFSSSANGLVCRDCEASFPDKIKLTKKATRCLSNLNRFDKLTTRLIADADKKTLNEIEKLLIRHFTEILHHQPKMAKHIQKQINTDLRC
jgi:DNA repair protein RecO (recombination protein O)